MVLKKRQVVYVLAALVGAHTVYTRYPSAGPSALVIQTPHDFIPPALLHPNEVQLQHATEPEPSTSLPPPSPPVEVEIEAEVEVDPVEAAFGHGDTDVSLSASLPTTQLLSHSAGWTTFRDVYMSNGTLFLVVPAGEQAAWPEFQYMTSTGLEATGEAGNIEARMPTPHEMAFISPEDAQARWGAPSSHARHAVRTVQGNTILYNDPPQFLDHYYHLAAELLFGSWAAWRGTFHDALRPLAGSFNRTTAPVPSDADPRALPHRAVFAHSTAAGWRDKYGLNALFLRAAFPSLAVEDAPGWQDRIAATAAGASAWHFPVLLLADRSAAFRGPVTSECHRTAAAAYYPHARAGALGADWWEPVRRAVLAAVLPTLPLADRARALPAPDFGYSAPGAPSRVPLVPDDLRLRERMEGGARRLRLENAFDDAVWERAVTAEASLRTHAAALEAQGTLARTPGAPAPGVITYISRQGSRRRLREADHAALVAALEELAGRRGWELNVVRAEALTTAQQLALAARSTVLLGVHGNGLTHLLMLAPTPRTTVVEIFYPGGFAHDYEWTARALGLRHYAVRNDTSATWPELPWVAYPEGFQGTDIPVHAPTVAALIEGRMDGTL